MRASSGDALVAPSPWPSPRGRGDPALGAVSLSFDDGMASQLRTAVPLLAEYGLRATFYVNPRDNFDLAPWAEVAAAGHEVGNHTVTHPCSWAFRDSLDVPCLERMTMEELEADVLEAERRLRAAIPDHGPRSFCYPCYLTQIGEGASKQSYVPMIAKHFPAARGRGERPNHPLTCDLHHLWSWPVERAGGAELVGLVERAATMGRWVILTFHGADEGHLSVAAVDLRELLDHLSRHKDRLWTAPIVEVAQRVAEWRGAAPRPVKA